MVADFVIREGLDIQLAGKPSSNLKEIPASEKIILYPSEIKGIKARAVVKEGDTIKQGGLLFYDKNNEAQKFRSPAAGRIEKIVLGARRALDAIEIKAHSDEESEHFNAYTPAQLAALDREVLLAHLLDTGLLALIHQRPFSKPANGLSLPKSIFINGMHNAPFRVELLVAMENRKEEFQAGLIALSRLTNGKVHLCVEEAKEFSEFKNVETHTFKGPHPAGNSSTHIHLIDPISPGNTVWVVNGPDVIQIGELLLKGKIPSHKIILLAGPGISEENRHYYRAPIGMPLSKIMQIDEEVRLICGDIFFGEKILPERGISFLRNNYVALPEERKRRFMGWLVPGLNIFSVSRAYLSGWLGRNREWALNTSRRGSLRSLVLTGIYDRYVPLNIMVDFLIRACIAHDTEEAVQLGILETAPEDFALCSIICPSKTDFSNLIQRTLNEIETEGMYT